MIYELWILGLHDFLVALYGYVNFDDDIAVFCWLLCITAVVEKCSIFFGWSNCIAGFGVAAVRVTEGSADSDFSFLSFSLDAISWKHS